MLETHEHLVKVFVGDEIVGMTGDGPFLEYKVDSRLDSIGSNVQYLRDDG